MQTRIFQTRPDHVTRKLPTQTHSARSPMKHIARSNKSTARSNSAHTRTTSTVMKHVHSHGLGCDFEFSTDSNGFVQPGSMSSPCQMWSVRLLSRGKPTCSNTHFCSSSLGAEPGSRKRFIFGQRSS